MGGVGKAKTRGAIVRRGGLIFLVLFVPRQKEQYKNRKMYAKQKSSIRQRHVATVCFYPHKTS